MDDRRYRAFLLGRYRLILGHLGTVATWISLVLLAPVPFVFVYPAESDVAAWMACTGLATAVLGMALERAFPARGGAGLGYQEGAVLVLLSWVFAVVVGAIPFLTLPGMDATRAIFESTSGWTTTGLSVVDVENAPRLILLHRSFLQFAGGAGFAILVLASAAGPAGLGVFNAEGRGDTLLPHVRRSARLVMGLYGAYAAVGTVSLRVAGMSLFDAMNHSMAAVSTGGFSTRAASLGYWDSPIVEAVMLPLMLLGSVNFVVGWSLVRGRVTEVARDGEVRLAMVLLPTAILVLFVGVTSSLYPTLDKAARVAIFEAVSALTTTGFSTVPYDSWNPLGWAVLVTLMIVGGGTGSTAGGLKLHRVNALWAGLRAEFRRLILPPEAVVAARVTCAGRSRLITDDEFRRLGLHLFVYAGCLAAGTVGLSAEGLSLRDAVFEFASSLGTVGLSCGATSMAMPVGAILIETAGMFLGRLEFFVVVVALIKMGRHALVLGRPEKR